VWVQDTNKMMRIESNSVRRVVALATSLAIGLSTPAFAQLSRVAATVSSYVPGGIMRGSDVAWDPVNNVYLEVVGNGPIYGVFTDPAGGKLAAFPIFSNDGSNWAHFPHVEYGAGVNGGAGGFLVSWNHNVGNVNYVWARAVSYTAPGYLVSSTQLISDGVQGGTWHETGPAIAYSVTSQRFLVAWRSIQYGIRGRFVNANGAPDGVIMQFENPGGSRDPAVAWNPATNEFGLVYTGFGGSGAFTSFRRIGAADGAISARQSFGFRPATFATGIDVTYENDYVMVWAIHPGTLSAKFDQAGNQLSAGTLVTSRFGYDQSLAVAYNTATGTLLPVGSDGSSWELAAAEMDSNGNPASTAAIITDGAIAFRGGSFYPMVTQRNGTNQWNVVYSRNFAGATTQIMDSAAVPTGRVPRPTVALDEIGASNQSSVPFTISAAASAAGYSASYSITDGSHTVTGNGTLGSNGSFATTVNLSSFSDGTVTATATLTDTKNNAGSPGTDTSTKDVTPPAAPTIAATNANAANVTRVPLTITGESGATATYTITDGVRTVTGTGTLSSPFSTTVNLSSLSDGNLTYSATLTDPRGNTSQIGSAGATKDVTPPAAPVLNLPYITSANESSVLMTITGEYAATIAYSVSDGRTSVEGVGSIPPGGVFSPRLNLSTLQPGPIGTSATLMDAAGNISAAGVGGSRKDTAPPAPTVSMPDVNASNQTAVPLTVNGTPGAIARFSISDSAGAAVHGDGYIASNGIFNTAANLSGLRDGRVLLVVTATNDFGWSPVGWDPSTKDVTGPLTPGVTLPDIDSSNQSAAPLVVSGEVGTSVSYRVTDGTTAVSGSGTIGGAGLFSVNVNVSSLRNGWINASATVTDAAGNVSGPGSDTSAKNVPAVTPTPTPTPTPPAQQCSTADPFRGLGGGTCCNGGWLPPGLQCQSSGTTTPTPPPSSSTCATPDPFANIPGMYGECVNGGWIPRFR
jgi:hypothetical protein